MLIDEFAEKTVNMFNELRFNEQETGFRKMIEKLQFVIDPEDNPYYKTAYKDGWNDALSAATDEMDSLEKF